MMMDDMEMAMGVDMVDAVDMLEEEGRSRNRVAPIATAPPLKILGHPKILFKLSESV